MSTLKIYADTLSPYARAVVLFAKVIDTQFELIPLELNQGDSRKPEYLEMNPQGGVPFIDDNGFRLPESVAIVKYLAASRVPEQEFWYPTDLKKRAEIDRILNWFGMKGDHSISAYGFKSTICAAWFKLPAPDAEAVAKMKSERDTAIKAFNQLFLEKAPGPFLFGAEMTIADICLAPRFTQLHALADEEVTGIYELYPKLKAWLKAVQAATEPHWSAVHEKYALCKGKCDEWRATQA
eukprot:TRINITY_DN20700_c1_g1_i1.p1 TRINITY_DN20700_c1_g1~~TRINITY_DN20700_c1_g1_i1.p1  ORF type:complete len:238 (+),score=43.79 TRINITY_DN20700_c1_g1_i1:130-843(+)